MTIAQVLDNLNSAKIVSLTTKTSPKLLKKGRISGLPCPYDKIYKLARRNGIIGCSYESCVNRQRAREGQPTDENDVVQYFDALELWNGKGEHVGRFLVRHKEKGTFYIVFKPVTNTMEIWQDEQGNKINPARLTEWLALPSISKRQEVDNPVVWRTIELSHIISIAYAQQEIELEAA